MNVWIVIWYLNQNWLPLAPQNYEEIGENEEAIAQVMNTWHLVSLVAVHIIMQLGLSDANGRKKPTILMVISYRSQAITDYPIFVCPNIIWVAVRHHLCLVCSNYGIIAWIFLLSPPSTWCFSVATSFLLENHRLFGKSSRLVYGGEFYSLVWYEELCDMSAVHLRD